MAYAPIPANEEERLKALQRYEILDTPPEQEFDDITSLAAEHFGVPISAISLIDRDRQWFKSYYGLEVCQTDRDAAICAHVILSPESMVVVDARADARFADSPLVEGDPNIRFYAGVPLNTYDGFKLGTLCIIDRKPRSFSQEEMGQLERMASTVTAQLELRLANIKLRQLRKELKQDFRR